MNTISSWRIKIVVKPTNAEAKAVFLAVQTEIITRILNSLKEYPCIYFQTERNRSTEGKRISEFYP
jgi:hypothetical protein